MTVPMGNCKSPLEVTLSRKVNDTVETIGKGKLTMTYNLNGYLQVDFDTSERLTAWLHFDANRAVGVWQRRNADIPEPVSAGHLVAIHDAAGPWDIAPPPPLLNADNTADLVWDEALKSPDIY